MSITFSCLNPCFSGGWSRRRRSCSLSFAVSSCLNPCFSGGWSRRPLKRGIQIQSTPVLILVLVEDGLGAPKKGYSDTIFTVLILVLVEDGLGGP